MMNKLLLIFFICSLSFLGHAQPKTPEQLARAIARASIPDKFDSDNELYYQKKYYYAIQIFLNLAKESPSNHHFNYKVGACYLKSNTERTKALPYLKKAITGVSKNFDPYSYQHKSAPYETYFFLGQAYHLDYQFDLAIDNFELFKTKVSKKHELLSEADLHISQCNLARGMVKDPRTDITLKNLGEVINTRYAEYSPVVSLDGNVMYFTSRRVREDSSNIDQFNFDDGKHYEDVYVSFKDRNGEWQKPTIVGFSEIDRMEATISVSADGMELFTYINGDLCYSTYSDTSFDDFIVLGEGITDINTEAWETHATVSPDGNTLYFVSDRKGGLGGRDLYYVKKLPNGDWGLAQNMGSPINSPHDEEAPFIAADGKTLYFSTNGSKSMGGFDVFVTRKNDDGSWEEPKNIGYPINTVDDDVFFTVSADGVTGYFSSLHEERDGNTNHGKDMGYGEKDIYEVKFKEVVLAPVAILKGYIIPKPGDPIPSDVQIFATDKTSGERRGPFAPRRDDGGYVLSLVPCHEYHVEYFIDGNFFSETEFKVPCEADIHTLHNEIYLDPTVLGNEEDSTPMASMLNWKIIDSPIDLTSVQVNYYDEKGEISGSVTIGPDKIFRYPNGGHKYSSWFQIDGQDEIICKSTCVARIDSIGNIEGYAIRDKNCNYFYEDVARKWQLVDKHGNPYKKPNVKVIYKDENGNISFEEKISCSGMFAYQPLQSKGTQFFELKGLDVNICDEAKIILLDEENNIIGETTRDEKCRYTYGEKNIVDNNCDVPPGSYQKFFQYNMKDINADEADFKKFVDQIEEIIKCKGKARIDIESSASKVPTSTYGSNLNLTKKRAADAKQRLMTALKKRGYGKDKIVISSYNTLVQGPRYKDDYIENQKVYEKYQYVKLKAK